ncbi:MAG: tetratricopeptide repeat protein [Ignavibacteriales bacterium]
MRTAEYHLQNDKVQNAVIILRNGIKFFPEHPLAFILMGKAQIQLGNTDLAANYFRKAGDLLNSNDTFNFYKDKFNLPEKIISPFDSSRGNIFLNKSDSVEFLNSNENQKAENNIAIEDRLEQIAKDVMNTKFERINDPGTYEYKRTTEGADKSKLASETLAKIYLSQGGKKEAIEIYRILIQRNPDKEEFYLKRIEEIRSL